MNPTKPPATMTESILRPFAKSWSAMLLLVILCGLGYEAHVLVNSAGKNVSEYVKISGKNLDALMSSSAEAAKSHALLQEALAKILVSSDETRDEVIINSKKLAEILLLLEESIQALKSDAPGEQEQMASLKRIELAIAELTTVVKEGQRLTDKKITEDSQKSAAGGPR